MYEKQKRWAKKNRAYLLRKYREIWHRNAEKNRIRRKEYHKRINARRTIAQRKYRIGKEKIISIYNKTAKQNMKLKWAKMNSCKKTTTLLKKLLKEIENARDSMELGKTDVKYLKLIIPRINACLLISKKWREDLKKLGK